MVMKALEIIDWLGSLVSYIALLSLLSWVLAIVLSLVLTGLGLLSLRGTNRLTGRNPMFGTVATVVLMARIWSRKLFIFCACWFFIFYTIMVALQP